MYDVLRYLWLIKDYQYGFIYYKDLRHGPRGLARGGSGIGGSGVGGDGSGDRTVSPPRTSKKLGPRLTPAAVPRAA